jgi:hypothetical protein
MLPRRPSLPKRRNTDRIQLNIGGILEATAGLKDPRRGDCVCRRTHTGDDKNTIKMDFMLIKNNKTFRYQAVCSDLPF